MDEINAESDDKLTLTVFKNRFWQWYAHAIANYSLIIIIFNILLCFGLTAVSFLINDLPQFDDPRVGFEARGTEVSNKINTWNNLVTESQWDGQLTLNPIQYFKTRSRQLKNKSDSASNVARKRDVRSVKKTKFGKKNRKSKKNKKRKKFQLCTSPSEAYSRFVIAPSVAESSLWSVDSIHSICRIDNRNLRALSSFFDGCEFIYDNECCPSWSIGNYIAALNKKSSCFDVDETDVKKTGDLLLFCAQFYWNTQLEECLINKINCDQVPHRCRKNRYIYDIFHYLLDINFSQQLATNSSDIPKLTTSLLFLPIARSSKTLEYYESLPSKIDDGTSKVVAMDLGVRDVVFDQLLINDLKFVGISAGIIMILMWMYTRSFFVTSVVILSIFMAVGSSYFMYSVVLGVQFFPFINCMVIIICLGVGVDDVFIYVKTWKVYVKECEGQENIEVIIEKASSQAMLSMFVTSLTTTTALIATYSSSITAIKCFSIFSSMTIFIHFIIIFWCLPSMLVLSNRSCCQKSADATSHLYTFIQTKPRAFHKYLFSQIIPNLIKKFHYFWILLFLILTITSSTYIYFSYNLIFPKTFQFHLFKHSHPFEQYYLNYADSFPFEKFSLLSMHHAIPLRVIWGLKSTDNGNYLNPYDHGKLEYDSQFNISSRESQEFLLAFCSKIRNQPFFKPTIGLHLSNCFIETFIIFMNRKCYDPILKVDYSPCCRNSTFPYDPDVFDLCLPFAMDDILKQSHYNALSPGPRFSVETGKMKVLVVEYETIYGHTSSDEIDDFYETVKSSLIPILESASSGLKNAWFVSDLSYYGLQNSLLFGALLSIGIASLTSFILVVVFTCDFRISLIAVISVLSVILYVCTTFILLNWTLDVFQSIVISVLIGLAADFIMHFSFAYKISMQNSNHFTVIKAAISRVSCPISMSFMTTFVAGLFMIFSQILVYHQIGIFLAMMSLINWFVSTFFLPSFLFKFGPVKS